MQLTRLALSTGLFLATLLGASSARAVTVTEPPDLSNTVATPTPVTLTVGANSVSGSIATPSDRQDNFLVTVPAGTRLTAVSLTLNTSGGFVGSVTFNLSEVRTSSGAFTMGLPLGPGSYYVQVITDFAIGNAWSMSFTVAATTPVCGNGMVEAGEACDDGNTAPCDGCSPTCTAAINGCSIGGTCVAEGTPDPTNACRACRRAVSRTVYSPVMAGVSCDDGQFCTVGDACNGAGACTGSMRDCSDSLACTMDACNETTNACTHAVSAGCLIGGACVAADSRDPANACRACRPAMSTTAYSPAAAGTTCDDALFCTVGDACNGAGACMGTARPCNDGDMCTMDMCSEAMARCTAVPIPGCGVGDAGPDTGTDAGSDAGGDAAADAGSDDGGADADTDTGVEPDASAEDASIADAGADASIVDAGADANRADARPADGAVPRDAGGDADGGTGGMPTGCGCRAAGGAARGPSWLAALGILVAALATTRRARARRASR